MKTVKGELITTIVTNDDNTKTFEVKREFKGVEGEDIILLQIFPTLGQGDEFTMDSTNRHLITHRKELNIKSVRFINLFSKRCNARMSMRNIEIDTENLNYIESIMQDKEFKNSRFVVAYGCSMKSSVVAENTKIKVLELFNKYHPNGKMYQITVDDLDIKNETAVHTLFLGIRHSNSVWRFKEFSVPVVEKKTIIEKKIGNVKRRKN